MIIYKIIINLYDIIISELQQLLKNINISVGKIIMSSKRRIIII